MSYAFIIIVIIISLIMFWDIAEGRKRQDLYFDNYEEFITSQVSYVIDYVLIALGIDYTDFEKVNLKTYRPEAEIIYMNCSGENSSGDIVNVQMNFNYVNGKTLLAYSNGMATRTATFNLNYYLIDYIGIFNIIQKLLEIDEVEDGEEK